MKDAIVALLFLSALGSTDEPLEISTLEQKRGVCERAEARADDHTVTYQATRTVTNEEGKEVPVAFEQRSFYFSETPDQPLRRGRALEDAARQIIAVPKLQDDVVKAIEDRVLGESTSEPGQVPELESIEEKKTGEGEGE